MEMESDEDDFGEEEIEIVENPQINPQLNLKLFSPLLEEELSQNTDKYNVKVLSETKKMHSYLKDSIINIQKIFSKNKSYNFSDFLYYLEKRAIPNKCVCAGVIETIPGWRCVDCSTYENSIYCNDCYKNSKDLHKNHTVYFLYSSGGMCDCGDPESLKTFCPKHTGPFMNKEQIQQFIEKSFSNDEIKKLTIFFDEFFYKFSRYFFILEEYDLFYNEYLYEVYPPGQNDENDENKKDIILLKKQFCIVFQNFLDFLRLISQKNIGMLHFIANYFLKNNLYINSLNEKDNEEFMTKHKCYKIEKDDIKILYTNNEIHKCVCPFMRLFLSNYREEIKSKENENEEFLLSFPHNLPLKSCFCISFFFLNKQLLYNNNTDIIYNRNQFFTEDTIELLALKTTLIEETYDVYYEYLNELLKSSKFKDNEGKINTAKLKSLCNRSLIIELDTKYYSKPKICELLTKKTYIVKKIIDAFCSIHNQMEFKSIFPHPFFQENKGFSEELVKIEFSLTHIIENINMYFNWNELEYSEEIFKYLIYKIVNQEKEGIKQLKENEFSFHLSLYRCFGLFINYFCFSYSIKNNCKLIDAINYFKSYFESKEEIELFVDKLLSSYFTLFGFMGGINNNYFNYYGIMNNYPFNYINKNIFLKVDFCTMKYLLLLSEKNFDIKEYLKKSNIENIFKIFSDIFFEKNNNNKTKLDNIESESIVNDINNKNPFKVLSKIYNKAIEYESDKTNCIMQWIFLFDIILSFMKDDSSPYYCLLRQYDEILTSQTKKELYNIIKENEDAYNDLKNILIEKIICHMISSGNLVDLRVLKKHIDNNLMYFFKDKNAFEMILDELTVNKMKGEIKMFYLKDKYLKNLDINYYTNPNDKSKAIRYIQNFKNDEIKSYNRAFFNPSKLTFGFFENTYQKILLNKDNLIMFKKIIEVLLDNKYNNSINEFNIKSLRSSLLPIMFNYLSNFGVINTKEFISFKIKNKEIINEIKNILLNSIENNQNNEILEKDLVENIKVLLLELDYYQIIYDDIKGDFSKLNEYDYNTKYKSNIKKENKEENSNVNKNENNIKKLKTQKLKEKYKLKMKNSSLSFIEKANNDKNIEMNLKMELDQEKTEENDKEIMCFFCRNNIELNKWEKPYGKIGLLIKDFFYVDSIKATLRQEIYNLNNKYNNKDDLIYEKYILDNNHSDIKERIVSCGHYFHYDCLQTNENYFLCPLCLKMQNIIVPPLNIFKNEIGYEFLNGEKIDILEKKEEKGQNQINIKYNNEISSFSPFVIRFLQKANLVDVSKSDENIDIFFNKYKNYFNFLENIFYSEGSTFNKKQQIDNLQNIILSYRYWIKACQSKTFEVIMFIKNNLSSLLKNSDENNIMKNCEKMYYVNLLDKIIFSLSILFDYEELKQTFIYLLYIFMPYFAFGDYLKYLSLKGIPLDKINLDNFKNYILENNDEMIKIFKSFLKKLTFVKLITDFSNTNDDIINTFNLMSIEQFLSVLNINNLYILLQKEKNKIYFLDIFEFLPKIFNLKDILFKEYKNDLKDIFNIIIKNVNNNKSDTKIYLTKELIINFNPIKFNLIKFDNKIFDWIGNNLEKKCLMCSKTSKYYYICLICGNKVCHTTGCNNFIKHAQSCFGGNSLFLDMDNMKICVTFKMRFMKNIFPLYLNEDGIGPNGYEIEDKFKLSTENLNSTIKDFVSYDYFFK